MDQTDFDADASKFVLRHKISAAQQFTVHIVFMLVPNLDKFQYVVIVAQLNRLEDYKHIPNVDAKKIHFTDHFELEKYDVDQYALAFAKYQQYVAIANQHFAGRATFWD